MVPSTGGPGGVASGPIGGVPWRVAVLTTSAEQGEDARVPWPRLLRSELADLIAFVVAKVQADRGVIVRFDPQEQRSVVMATAGRALCQPGARLPIELSSLYCANVRGDAMVATALDRLDRFDRISDRALLSMGMRSAISLPLWEEGEPVGALYVASVLHDPRSLPRFGLPHLQELLAEALAQPSPGASARVLICHDDPIAAAGLAGLCEAGSDLAADTCGTLAELRAELAGARVDAVVCDNYFAGLPVDALAEVLSAASSGARRLVVVASHDTPQNLAIAAQAGASGYLTRQDAPALLAASLRRVVAGHRLLRDVADAAVARVERLTPREAEILTELDRGLRVKQVAVALGISEHTVRNHMRAIFRKLAATSRSEALREARRQGFLAA